MLVLYSAYVFFPGGDLAVNYPVRVTHLGSNTASLIFSDGSGTPAANPISTDGDGLLAFYSAPGLYGFEISGTFFPVPLDSSVTWDVWPDLSVFEQASPSSVWTIDHHFGVAPSVDLVTGPSLTEAQVTHPTTQQTVITFGSPQTGTAYLRR